MSKINLTFKGKQYEIDKTLLDGAIASLEASFEELANAGGNEEPVWVTYQLDGIGGSVAIEGFQTGTYRVKTVYEADSTWTFSDSDKVNGFTDTIAFSNGMEFVQVRYEDIDSSAGRVVFTVDMPVEEISFLKIA